MESSRTTATTKTTNSNINYITYLIGLQYLHSQHPPIIHRDLRSFNIFVFSLDYLSEVIVKIGDFGLSVISCAPTKEPLESWQWLAPEVIMIRRLIVIIKRQRIINN